jgi:hypothetical protein
VDIGSRSSSVSTVTDYELDVWDSIPGKDIGFSLRHSIQKGSGFHPGGSLFGGKAAGA